MQGWQQRRETLLPRARVWSCLERTQIARSYTPGGHGFAAEDANTLLDRLRGRVAEVVGMSNAVHGADRVVDGVLVIAPGVGTTIGGFVGGLVGSVGGGLGAAKAVASGLNRLSRGNAPVSAELEELGAVLREELERMAGEYLVNEAEMEQVASVADTLKSNGWMRKLHEAKDRREFVRRLEHDVDDDWLREYEGAEHRREFLRPKLEACVEEAVHERPEEVRCRTAERETADLAAEYLLDETELGVASDALRGIVQTLTARPQGRVSAAEGLAPRIRKQLEGRVFQIVKKRPKIGPLPTLGQARRLLNLPPPGADAPPAAPSP